MGDTNAQEVYATDPEITRWNERQKLRANWFNNVGVGVVLVGFVTPLAAMLYGLSTAPPFDRWQTYALPLVSLIAGSVIHDQGSRILGTLV